MPKAGDELTPIIQQIRFVGTSAGTVKTLSAFKKSHHTVPEAVNSATQGFLAKLCADELAAEAETYFQRAREIFGYKRKDLTLDLSSPSATLISRDFTFEVVYGLNETEPAEYVVARRLSAVRHGDFLRTAETDDFFAGVFSELVFALSKGARVEDVIDAIEGLPTDEERSLSVNYPSDCAHCTLAVGGVDAEVRFDGSELAVVFPRSGSPRELVDAFGLVRDAFALTKSRTLAGMFR